MEIIERILKTMDEKGIKQVDIANTLDINKSVIANWKKRKANPPLEYIEDICKILNVSLSYIITGKETETSEIERIYNTLSKEDKKIVDIIFEKYRENNNLLSISKSG